MKTLIAGILFAAAAPFVSAQADTVRWKALHYTLKLEWVTSTGAVLTEASLERTELIVVTTRGGREEQTLVATERGFANPNLRDAPPLPGEVYTLAGVSGTRYQLTVQNNAVTVTRQGVEWRENPGDHVALQGTPETVTTIALGAKAAPAPLVSVVVEARELFSRELSLQTKRLHGDDVWVLQRCLLDENYQDVGEVDGWFGPATRKAVMRFQENVGLPVTGVVDAATWKALVGPDDNETIYSGD